MARDKHPRTYYVVTQDNKILLMGDEGLKLWCNSNVNIFDTFHDANIFKKICENSLTYFD